MNILGKILVFLNLLFALAVGGFLLIDFQTRVNWKKAHDDLKREFDVSRGNNKAQYDTQKALKLKLDDADRKLVEERGKFELVIADAKVEVAKLNNQMANLAEEGKAALLTAKTLQGQIQALQLENKTLTGLLDKRDKTVLILDQEKDKYFKDAQNAENERQIAMARMQQMQKQLSVLQLDLYKMQVTAKGDFKGPIIKDKNSPNPPPFYIKGKVEKVDKDDSTLVLISLGSDHGIAVGQTLEAFRKTPQAKYLGMLRIEEVTAHKSVARLVPSAYAAPPALKIDDEVASQILPGY